MEPPHSGPLVPILRIDQVLGDRVALATWHEALSDTLSADLPHDLLGLWLYPAARGRRADRPRGAGAGRARGAAPVSASRAVAARRCSRTCIRDAGYPSVACVPVRSGRRDVGLVLAADLRAERYGEDEPGLTLRAGGAAALAELLGRMARRWNGRRRQPGQSFLARRGAGRRARLPVGAREAAPQLLRRRSWGTGPRAAAAARPPGAARVRCRGDARLPSRRARRRARFGRILRWRSGERISIQQALFRTTDVVILLSGYLSRTGAGPAAISRSRSRPGRRSARWWARACKGRRGLRSAFLLAGSVERGSLRRVGRSPAGPRGRALSPAQVWRFWWTRHHPR